MESKYYTPEIEEFHVGFEFLVPMHGTDEYVKMVFDIMTPTYCFSKNEKGVLFYPENFFKVKHLDRKDIESLGWQYFKNYRRYYKGDIELNVCDYNTIAIHTLGDYDNEKPHFSGNIKNKSELKKLMQQLNIK